MAAGPVRSAEVPGRRTLSAGPPRPAGSGARPQPAALPAPLGHATGPVSPAATAAEASRRLPTAGPNVQTAALSTLDDEQADQLADLLRKLLEGTQNSPE